MDVLQRRGAGPSAAAPPVPTSFPQGQGGARPAALGISPGQARGPHAHIAHVKPSNKLPPRQGLQDLGSPSPCLGTGHQPGTNLTQEQSLQGLGQVVPSSQDASSWVSSAQPCSAHRTAGGLHRSRCRLGAVAGQWGPCQGSPGSSAALQVSGAEQSCCSEMVTPVPGPHCPRHLGALWLLPPCLVTRSSSEGFSAVEGPSPSERAAGGQGQAEP